MARIRTIKPEIASDVKLAAISIQARYTFVLLISQADDEGLVAGSHRQLLGTLYPHDERVTTGDLLGWVEELVTVGLVRWRSTTDGAPILELTNWTKHQRIDNKGRSQLAGLLVPLAATLDSPAESRGESPRTAETRRLEEGVGSRTLDLGPRTGAASIADPVTEFVDSHDFGPFAQSVTGVIRSARNPAAVMATLAMHLSGEMGHERASPEELGLACQQYQANGEQQFKPAFFAGFIRRTKQGIARTENRKRNASEDRRVADEEKRRQAESEEEQRLAAMVATFEDRNPERYAELQALAEKQVPAKITFGRHELVRAQLIRLIREAAA